MLSTRCSQDYVIHTLFTPCSQTGSASLKLQSKLDRKSVVPRSTDIVRADHRQADNLQASWPPGSHQGAVAYSENGVRELARLFRKRECRCRGRSLLPCCAGCFEPLSGKASSDLSSGSYSVGPMLRPGAQDLRRSVREVCRSRFGRSMARR